MAKFKVEYPNGKVEVTEQSDCATIEQFVNTRFGTVKTEAKVSLAGVKSVEEPVAKKAETPSTKKAEAPAKKAAEKK